MYKRTTLIAVAIIIAFLGAACFWYSKQAVSPERPIATSPQPIEKQGENTVSNADTQTQASWQSLAMEWPTDVLDVSLWEKHDFKLAGVEALLPKTWRVSENSTIYPEENDESWISMYRSPLPEYFNGKIGKGKGFSVAEAIMSKHLVYDDGYQFALQRDRFNEISVPIGSGVEYPKLSDPFPYPGASKHEIMESRLFILFSEKTKKTYSFEYRFPQDSYNPVIDRAFEEVVKSARVLE